MATDALLRVSAQGSSTRRGADLLDADAPAISTAIRRALPFLMRRGVAVTPKAAFAGTIADLEDFAFIPGVALSFAGTAFGHVAIDRNAADKLIYGVLGGDGQPGERTPTLTPAQAALAARITQTLARCMADRLEKRFTTRVDVAPGSSTMPSDGVFFLCFFEIGEDSQPGTILLAVPRSVVGGGETVKRERFMKPDPGVVHLLSDVEIDVAVHLGHAHVPLHKLATLAAGDVLLTEVPVSGSVTVVVHDKPLFEGKPTSVAGRFGVKLEHKIDG